jgi:hypothetical protein
MDQNLQRVTSVCSVPRLEILGNFIFHKGRYPKRTSLFTKDFQHFYIHNKVLTHKVNIVIIHKFVRKKCTHQGRTLKVNRSLFGIVTIPPCTMNKKINTKYIPSVLCFECEIHIIENCEKQHSQFNILD